MAIPGQSTGFKPEVSSGASARRSIACAFVATGCGIGFGRWENGVLRMRTPTGGLKPRPRLPGKPQYASRKAPDYGKDYGKDEGAVPIVFTVISAFVSYVKRIRAPRLDRPSGGRAKTGAGGAGTAPPTRPSLRPTGTSPVVAQNS